MEKKHSLPDINLNYLGGQETEVEDVIGVDREVLLKRIRDYFDNNVKLEKVFTKKMQFTNFMNDVSLKGLMDLYNSFSDRELIYALWNLIDAQMRLYCFDKVQVE